MILIQDKIISDDVIKEHFACALEACKGACCIEGDLGAPVEESETAVLELIFPVVKPYLLPEGIRAIEAQGTFVKTDEGFATPLIDGGPCAYYFRKRGIAYCGIEKAWREGLIDFQKPVSCHLYPIRLTETKGGITFLNYDRWDICKSACAKGESLGIRVYEFLKEPLIRRFGEAFYEELDAAATYKRDKEY